MKFVSRRASSAALVVAAGLASAAIAPAWADQGRIGPGPTDEGRVITVQADLQKRADMLLKSMSAGGGKVKFGAIEQGDGKDGIVIKDVEVTSADGKTAKIESIVVRTFDWE